MLFYPHRRRARACQWMNAKKTVKCYGGCHPKVKADKCSGKLRERVNGF